ncbi:MAG: tetratricopeptide repeat protein [Myxococcota bacterium]|nr:tetratricopeptide repeat protein [Myxococcota bacterium]
MTLVSTAGVTTGSSRSGGKARTTVSGVATLCQDCGRKLTDDFDQTIGLCEEHQVRRKAFLGILKEEAVSAVPRAVSVAPRKSSRRVSVAPTTQKSSSRGMPIFLFVVTLILVSGAAYYFRVEIQKQVPALADVAKLVSNDKSKPNQKPNPLSEWLQVWRLALGQVQGLPTEFITKAEKKHELDTWADYEEADDSLKRALVLDPQSPKAIGLFVENLAVWRGNSLTEQELKICRSALDYAEPLPEENAYIARARAALAFAAGNSSGSREFAEQVITTDPKDARARVQLAETYLEVNRKLAIEELANVLTQRPNLARAMRLMAAAQLKEGRFAYSLKILNKRIERAPRDAALHNLAGDIQVELGELRKAQIHYENAVQGRGNRLAGHIRLGNTYLLQLKPELSLKHFNAVIYGRGTTPELRRVAHLGSAHAHLMSGNLAKAYKSAKEYREEESDMLASSLILAEAALLAGNATKAVAQSEIVLNRNKESVDAIVINAIGNIESKLPSRAAKLLEGAVKSGLDDPRILAVQYAAYLAMNLPEKATTVAKAIGSIDPKENGARMVQDPYATKLKTWQMVRKYLRPTSKSRMKVAEAFSVLAVLLYFTGDSKGFQRTNQSALKADKDNTLARLYQVYSAFEQEKFEDCLKDTQTLLEIDRSSIIGQLMLARVQKSMGKTAEAKASYDTALLSSPGLTIAKVELAAIAIEAGKKNEAIKELLEAYRLYPKFRTTRRLLLAAGY